VIELFNEVTKFWFGALGVWILLAASVIMNIRLWFRVKKLDREINEFSLYFLFFENSLKGTKK